METSIELEPELLDEDPAREPGDVADDGAGDADLSDARFTACG